ncbi:DUF3558 domain-containing protein [Saccharothrix texasensis]|uniref:Uncharacterized protein DUF3558 n=1 Tax=Saccharothrix texasensis TaxID=103734 RepID=A0A3N1HCZ3_9PSEU|nr:DUF3558 domain-containing protein [Saccharothrix texasensis]ROP40373.1 uncharacterized protein DUF3558 [Saccharothrix texasensis]
MNSRTASIGLLAATLLAAAACSKAIEGTPVPIAGAGPAPPSSTGTTSASAAPALAAADPCGLVSEEEVERALGGLDGEPRRRDIGTARSCEYEVDAQLVVIDVRTNVGLEGIDVPGPVTDLTVGKHQVKTWVTESGSCFFAFGVTASSRVDVAVQPKAGKAQCELAKRLADVVEPKLP